MYVKEASEIRFDRVANLFTQQHYAKGSVDRQKLQDAVARMKKQGPVQVPLAIGGEYVRNPEAILGVTSINTI